MNINFFRSLKNQMGFTLPEIMVGTAIIAGVALAGATLFKNQGKAQSKLNHSKNLIQFHSKLSKLLANNYNCSMTMNAAVSGGVINPGPLTQVVVCDTANFQTGCNSKEYELSQLQALNMGISLINTTQYIDATNVWQLQSINVLPRNPLAPAAITSTGPVTLRFTYIKNSRLSSNETVTKDVVVNARFGKKLVTDTLVFKECFNDQESSINNLQNDLCKSMTRIASDGTIAEWNDATQQCELKANSTSGIKDCTADGLAVEGIDANGALHCRSLGDGFDAAGAVDTSMAQNCVNGTKIISVWVTGPPRVNRLKVVCQ